MAMMGPNQNEAMQEVETAEAMTFPTFRCGVYTQQVVIDRPISAGFIDPDADPQVLEYHYEDIKPTPWFRFDPPQVTDWR